MRDTLGKMREASSQIDDVLVDNEVLPRHVLDNRKYQRQNLVSSILGEVLPIDENAIYVPDRTVPPRMGEYLFRRTRSYDPEKVFGGRVKKHTGQALVSGRVDPSFANYYTSLTSAMSKTDAIKFQKDMLDRYAHKVPENQITYDADRFVL